MTTDKMDRATKRFGKKPNDNAEGAKPKGEGAAEKKAESTAGGKDAPHAEPARDAKPVAMKPNAHGATGEGMVPRDEMAERHGAELEAMQGRHMQEMKDMHGRHVKEMEQMHGRHGVEIGNGAGATAEKGPSLPSAKKAAGKGWKTKEKSKSGTEPKGGEK